MKFISWNIDSINAALTSTSARSELSRNVLEMIKQEDADIIAIQETKLPISKERFYFHIFLIIK